MLLHLLYSQALLLRWRRLTPPGCILFAYFQLVACGAYVVAAAEG